jgi:hypothetical protein
MALGLQEEETTKVLHGAGYTGEEEDLIYYQ